MTLNHKVILFVCAVAIIMILQFLKVNANSSNSDISSSMFQSPLPTVPLPPPAPTPPTPNPNPTFDPTPTFINDTTPPNTSIQLSGTSGNAQWFVSPVTITLNAVDDISGVDYTIYSLNNDPITTYKTPFVVQDEQEYTIKFYSADKSANDEAIKYSYFKIDMTPPTISHLLIGKLLSNGVYYSQVTINFGGDDNLSGIDHLEFNLNSAGWQNTINSYTLTEPGEHILVYRAIDKAGNMSTTETVTFTIQADYLVFEAESYNTTLPRNNQSWPTLTHLSGYTGTGYVTARPDRGVLYDSSPQTTAPELQYDLTLPLTGTYHIWLRGAGADAEGDEVYVALVEQGVSPTTSQALTGFPPFRWGWANINLSGSPVTATVTTTGTHTLYLWPREDGISIDRILLTDNPGFVPVGQGPD